MDSIVKGKIAGDVDKGTLEQAAYQKLVERIQENMRAGLVVYAINYTNIDLEAISAEILPASYKELIRNNENVIATNTINKCLESKQKGVITQTRIEEFNRQIDKFIGKNVIINDLIAKAKEKIKSPEYNDRYDACGLLRYLINIDIDVQLTFLKSDMATKAMGAENNTITLVTEFFDADWDSLVNGQIKFEELPEDAQEYITKAGYDINNYNDRIAMLRERLYTFSNNTLTVSYNGEVLQILDKNKLVKNEYLGEKGNEKLLTDIQNGKVKKVKDICKITINETIGELDLVLNPNISSNGYFSENNPTRITIAGINTVNTIMHEATHATQYYIRPDKVTTMSTGASLEYLQNVKANVLNKIERYIKKTFPTTYTAMMQNPHANIPSIIYFNIDGEMQAMCKLTNLIFESGFTWNADKTKIYSPDGKDFWDLELKTDKRKSDTKVDNDSKKDILLPYEYDELSEDEKKNYEKVEITGKSSNNDTTYINSLGHKITEAEYNKLSEDNKAKWRPSNILAGSTASQTIYKRKSKGVIKDEKQSSSISNVNDWRDGKNTVKEIKSLGRKQTTSITSNRRSRHIEKRFEKISGHKVTKIGNIYVNQNIQNNINNKIVQDTKNKYGIDVLFYNGLIFDENEEQISAKGFTDGTRVFVREDLSDKQIEKVVQHEYFHIKRNQNKTTYNKLKKSFLSGVNKNQLSVIIDNYAEVYVGLSANEVLEEILADISAGVITVENSKIDEFNKLLDALYNHKSVTKIQSKKYVSSVNVQYAKDPNSKLMAITGIPDVFGLIENLKKGYMTMPSIGINSTLTNTQFGNMYIIWDKEVVDLEKNDINIYYEDAWTSRVPIQRNIKVSFEDSDY